MFERLLARIAATLKKLKIPYMVVGGQAVLVYGEARTTKDIDITLGVGVEELPALLRAIKKINLEPKIKDVERFVRDTMVLPVMDKKSGIGVDFIFSFSPYEKQALSRVRKFKIGITMISFASLEDLIVYKMIAGRPRDLEDIRSLILKNPGYDFQYIIKWLTELGAASNQNFLDAFKRIG